MGEDKSITSTEISGFTSDSMTRKSLNTVPTTGTGSTSHKQWNKKWGVPCKNKNLNTNIVTFKEGNTDLKGKVFIKGPLQAAKYDEAYKAILTYIRLNYDNKVYNAFE